jgi:hypothetical protein
LLVVSSVLSSESSITKPVLNLTQKPLLKTIDIAPLAPLAMAKVPFFAQDGVDEPYDPDADDEPELEEVPEATVATAVVDKSAQDKAYADEDNELEEDAVRKLKKASKMKTAGGVAYAPWMNISADEEDEIRKVMKSKSQARRKRQAEEASASGALVMDSQAQELSGGGLQTKIIDGAVELEWTTNSEASTKGYLVKRRAARTEEFEVIASYEDFGPLASKGPDGGAYRYLDSNITPGGWVYRITECEASGSTNDICQALVDVQTEEEQRGALIAAVSISAIAVAAVVAGIFLDPVGGY